MKKKILITGGAGFVGSNLAIFIKQQAAKDYDVVCFDNLIRKGSELNRQRLKDAGIKFIKGDVRGKGQLARLPKIDLLLECSAEPAVLAAYDNPAYMIDTNLIGMINCLNLAKENRAGIIFLSTSRVYPIEALQAIPYEEKTFRFDWKKGVSGIGFGYQGIDEKFPLPGIRSLYGATKLCGEHLMQEYLDMYDMKGMINRLSVIAGPWQMGKIDQGIVGYWVAQHVFKGKLKYIGYGGQGKQVRDAVHIDDVCELVFHQMKHMGKYNKEIFNAGGGRKNSFSLCELTTLAQNATNFKVRISSDPVDRKSDIRIYITNNQRILVKSGWQPKKSLQNIVEDVYDWIRAHQGKLRGILK